MATITVEKKQMVEVEVNYPMFKSYGGGVYKIMEDETIEIENWKDDDRAIRIGKICYTGNVILGGKDITEQQFNTAFVEALEFAQSKSPLS